MKPRQRETRLESLFSSSSSTTRLEFAEEQRDHLRAKEIVAQAEPTVGIRLHFVESSRAAKKSGEIKAKINGVLGCDRFRERGRPSLLKRFFPQDLSENVFAFLWFASLGTGFDDSTCRYARADLCNPSSEVQTTTQGMAWQDMARRGLAEIRDSRRAREGRRWSRDYE